MKTMDRIFFWSMFYSVMMFLIIGEFINDLPDIVIFIAIISNAICLGYAMVSYPILTFIEDNNDVNVATGEGDKDE